jgi:hypothetical protein
MWPGRVLSLVPVLAALAAGAGAAPGAPGPAPARPPRQVYLDFTDGDTGMTQGPEDDAVRNVSRLCGTPAFGRWEPTARCGERDRCREEVRRRVQRYFEAYQVDFTLSRPAPPAVFSTVVIAPPLRACTFGHRGVAAADCGDTNPTSVAFVFDCYGDAASCAVLVAHEAAHTFGLVHSLDPGDIMTPGPDDPALQFRDAAALAEENECGVRLQSSHQALLSALGPRRR